MVEARSLMNSKYNEMNNLRNIETIKMKYLFGVFMVFWIQTIICFCSLNKQISFSDNVNLFSMHEK